MINLASLNSSSSLNNKGVSLFINQIDKVFQYYNNLYWWKCGKTSLSYTEQEDQLLQLSKVYLGKIILKFFDTIFPLLE